MPAFTDKYIKSLKPKDKTFRIRENVGDASKGFLIRVAPTGVKTFYYVYKVGGKETWENLGHYPYVGLSDARVKYRALRGRRESGVLPGDVVANSNGTMRDLVDEYISHLRSAGRVSVEKILIDLNNHVLSIIGEDKLACHVTSNDIKLVLHSKIKSGALTYSNRLRQSMHAAFQQAIYFDNDPRYLDRDIRFGLTSNPVSDVPKNPSAERVGDRVLSSEELYNHWIEFSGIYAFAHKLMILLGGQRPIDILSTQWGDYDLDMKILDPSRSSKKNNRSNVLPLSNNVIEVLRALRLWSGDKTYLFPRGVSGRAVKDKDAVDSYLSLTGNSRAVNRHISKNRIKAYTTRDLRRTMKTMMGRAGIPKDMRDRLQNHALTDVSTRHYDRYDYLPEKKAALLVWEKYLKESIKLPLL